MANPYDLLGVSKTATDAEIKKAYHKLARTLHPDVNPDKKAAEKFKAVSAAYELLSDKEKRRRFDAGEIDENGNPTPFGAGAYDRGSGGFGGFGGGGQYRTRNINPEDLAAMFGGGGFGGAGGFNFADLFGMGGMGAGMGGAQGFQTRTRASAKGEDVSYELEIPFDLAVTGGETTVGLANGKHLKVKIPAGVNEEALLRLKGQGMPGRGVNGDALIKIHIQKSTLYTREGNNILMTVPLTLKEAVLGAKITLPTPSGAVALSVPPYTSSDKTLRLKGKGVAGKGDLLVKFNIRLPERSNAALTAFMEEWKEPTHAGRAF